MALARERRKGVKPIPDNLNDYLSGAQVKSLEEVRRFGWILFAIRRPLFQSPTVIVTNVDTNKFGILLEDGAIDYTPDITVRAAPSCGGSSLSL